MPVFELDPEPGLLRPKAHFENDYDYLCVSSRPKMLRVRNLVEQWFEEFPDGRRKDAMLAEIRSRRPHFDDTFFELFLYQLLRTAGLEVEPEPVGEPGDSRPDFLVTAPDGRQFFVEAAHSTGQTTAEVGTENRLHTLYDYVNANLRSPNVSWHVNVFQKGVGDPSQKQVVRELQQFHDQLDWGISKVSPFAGGWSVVIENNGWILEFEPIHVAENRRSAGNRRPLGSFGGNFEIVSSDDSLRTVLAKKKQQHRKVDKPLVIAINAANVFTDEEDVFNALYGTYSIAVPSGRSFRKPNGFWRDERGPRNSHVPYVITCYRVSPTNVAQAHAIVCPNPYIDLDELLQPQRIPRYRIIDGGLATRINGESLAEIFNLDRGWPSADHDR